MPGDLESALGEAVRSRSGPLWEVELYPGSTYTGVAAGEIGIFRWSKKLFVVDLVQGRIIRQFCAANSFATDTVYHNGKLGLLTLSHINQSEPGVCESTTITFDEPSGSNIWRRTEPGHILYQTPTNTRRNTPESGIFTKWFPQSPHTHLCQVRDLDDGSIVFELEDYMRPVRIVVGRTIYGISNSGEVRAIGEYNWEQKTGMGSYFSYTDVCAHDGKVVFITGTHAAFFDCRTGENPHNQLGRDILIDVRNGMLALSDNNTYVHDFNNDPLAGFNFGCIRAFLGNPTVLYSRPNSFGRDKYSIDVIAADLGTKELVKKNEVVGESLVLDKERPDVFYTIYHGVLRKYAIDLS